MPPIVDATTGAIGSLIANTLVFPLDVVKTRMQVQTKGSVRKYNSPRDALINIYKKEGIKGLYAGLGSGLAGTVVSSFSYFYIYSSIRGWYSKSINYTQISTAMELTLGAAAGALCQFFVLPIAVINTRQQTSLDDQGFLATLKSIVSDDGFQELWKGLKASLVLCTNPAITFGMFERLKAIYTKGDRKRVLTAYQAFILGALSKTLATIVTYPYIMAKVRMQWKPSSKELEVLDKKERENIKYKGAIDVLTKVYKSEGLVGWYNGMSAQILKAVLCQSIVFAIKEKLARYTVLLFAMLSKTGQTVKA